MDFKIKELISQVKFETKFILNLRNFGYYGEFDPGSG